MKYLSVEEIAEQWQISVRSVRNYCQQGRVNGAKLEGHSWQIPKNASKPQRLNGKNFLQQSILERLREERNAHVAGGLYHRLQIDMTYNSNHIEGSTLTHEQTRYIFETNTVANESGRGIKVDDIVETANHFRCIDMVLDNARNPLTEHFIKELHRTLKTGTQDSRKAWFAVGDYKKLPNFIGGDKSTVAPERVWRSLKKLLQKYNAKKKQSFKDLVRFHYEFECIHPFQDGNGRIGRLLLLKECLKWNIVPFIVEDEDKYYYYRGLQEYGEGNVERLEAVFLHAQDKFKVMMEVGGFRGI